MKNSKDEETLSKVERSEEVQAIIDRMPTKNAAYVILITVLLITVITILGFVIKYPDTVDGQVSITARLAPVRMVANASGKIHLLVDNKATVTEGEVIAYIDNHADYRDVLFIDSLLDNYMQGNVHELPETNGLLLGEISAAFNSFAIAHAQYYRMLDSDIYATMCTSLQQQNEINAGIIRNLDREIELKSKKLEIERRLLKEDSTLMLSKAVTPLEYNNRRSVFYDLLAAFKNLQNSRLSYQAQIKRNTLQIEQYLLEEQEGLEKLQEELTAAQSQLASTLHSWKQQYLQISPIDGQMEYLGFWRENHFVQNGQELFSILPNQNEIIGEVIVPSQGIGKVEVGQTANVKVDNFPYTEYGLIKGKVRSISRLSNKITQQTAAGGAAEGNVYRILVEFPDGLRTNFDKLLDLDFESKGTAEIITKPKRLIERLFDNLKSTAEK